jgi:hypothetical protein
MQYKPQETIDNEINDAGTKLQQDNSLQQQLEFCNTTRKLDQNCMKRQ